MDNPARGGASERRFLRLDCPEDTRTHHDPQAAARAIAAGLRCLAARPLADHALDLGRILRSRLDLRERVYLAAGTMTSLPQREAKVLARGTLAEIEDHGGDPLERERQRQTDLWLRHCRKTWPAAKRRTRP